MNQSPQVVAPVSAVESLTPTLSPEQRVAIMDGLPLDKTFQRGDFVSGSDFFRVGQRRGEWVIQRWDNNPRAFREGATIGFNGVAANGTESKVDAWIQAIAAVANKDLSAQSTAVTDTVVESTSTQVENALEQ